AGYYRNPKASSAVITADGWMDSGDLGYWAGGELYVTGRLKDCIIKSGRNIIPQEIEAAAAEVPGVRKGCVAAFGALDPATGTERLVVVAEARASAAAELQRIEEGVVKAVDAVLGIPPDKVVLVAPQSIPKTSSGKIRRNATRTLYLEGRLSGRRRPPWMQLARLWLENAGNGLKHWRGRSAAWLHRSFRMACFGAVGYSGGIVARLLPGRNAGLIVAKFAARAILRLGGHSVHTIGNALPQGGKPAVLISNRAGYLDPLVAMAYGPGRFFFADPAPLRDLPAATEFLLKHFSVPRVAEITQPPGGTPGARIDRCLANGFSVLVFPDGPVGAPPLRSRFRLDSLRAAVAASAPVYPVIFRGTEGVSWPDRHSESRARSSEIGMEGSDESGRLRAAQPGLLIGEALSLAGNSLHDMIRLRDRIRESLAVLDSGE
ncbi:MAG: hypothetical protein ACRD2G_05900, partial [Terriglobia bacterium]